LGHDVGKHDEKACIFRPDPEIRISQERIGKKKTKASGEYEKAVSVPSGKHQLKGGQTHQHNNNFINNHGKMHLLFLA
jgi:hypothetical protein